ncbi:MAG: hypothetical protein V4543_14770 [Bacteroidota bacterium]
MAEEVLHTLVLKKIASEWPKWRLLGHGEAFKGINALPSRRAFYADLQTDIRTTLAEKLSASQAAALMPAENTLRRFLEDHSGRSLRKPTLQALSLYLGYESYIALKAANAHLFKPATMALVHIKRVHRQPRTNNGLLKWKSAESEKSANVPDYEDTSYSIVKSWYRKPAVLTVLAFAVLAAGYFTIKFMQPPPVEVSAFYGEGINFDKFRLEQVDSAGKTRVGRALFRYDFSDMGVDTLDVEFEKSIMPSKLHLTKKTGTVMLYRAGSASQAILTAKRQSGTVSTMIGVDARWHYLREYYSPEYDYMEYAELVYHIQEHPDLIRNGSISLTSSMIPEKYRFIYGTTLSSFGMFPPIKIDDFSIEYKFRFLSTYGQNREIIFNLYNSDNNMLCIALTDSASNVNNKVIFGYNVITLPDSDLAKLEVKFNTDWNTVRMEVKNGTGKLYCNNDLRVEGSFTAPQNLLLEGLKFRLNAETAIDYVRIKNSAGKLLYAEEFNDPYTVNSTDSTGNTFLKICGEAPAR